ncbi:hypothetical protein [Tropicibacter oceani]|uniref:Uncharacterized protein n=1 Tax=Tropicibacter oceani TaxID=3058420 RepID=A0ABY8QJL1_9RHOB|nr:hypothetical protein [Tropicibacter oceani]WGW04216.1 hypothetical protein QF118_01380 [Tropicibacter oceani]
MNVTIRYITEIPSQAVALPGAGTGFNGGRKSTLEAQIDLSVNGPGSLTVLTRSWGTTREYARKDLLDVAGKPTWYKSLRPGATALNTATLQLSNDNLFAAFVDVPDASHGVRLYVAGGNPLVVPSPEIDGEFIVSFRNHGGTWQYRVVGSHDGFPSHRIAVGANTVLDHDCVAQDQTPLSLLPPSEFAVSTGWLGL